MSLAGRLVYQLWHRPVGAVRHSLRHGGPLAQRAAAQGQRAMAVAAATLPPIPAPRSPLPAFTVHFLTGRRFAYQTAFCLSSLARYCPNSVHAEVYDDGTLDPASTRLLRRLTPMLQLHDGATLAAQLDEYLPASRFPMLRERWLHYPHIRKLIDVHLGRTGWRLVLDSDLLFWREPRFLLDWAAAPRCPLHAFDCVENYGYSRPLLERIAGVSLPARVNVGLCGLRSEALDWDFLEHATTALLAAERTNYYLEQALVAVLVARLGPCAIAPAADYITLPSAGEIARPTAVMHHYVDTARGAYFRHAWRKCIPTDLNGRGLPPTDPSF